MKSLIGSLIGLVLSVSVGAESLLEGRVRLSSGEPVAGVHVRLFDWTDLREAVGTKTDEAGYFALSLRADGSVYGLTVAGAGLVAYVDPAFRAGVDEADIVVEKHGGWARMKRAAGGILGDVNNDGQVDAFDVAYVALYSGDPSIVLPNNGDISLGDVNGDGTVDRADALLLAAYLVNPSDPALPQGIGQAGTATVSASPDSLALVALYNATDGAKWTDNTNWLSDKPIGQWYGVSTNDEGRVTKLSLGFNELSGAIPSALGNLSALIELSLHNNQLSGTIPAELGTLTNLTTLALANNQLSGCIPDGLQAVSNNDFAQLGLSFCGAVVSASPDSLALVALYQATNGAKWTDNTNWLSDKPIGQWYGVSTNDEGRVTKLSLGFNELSGAIPSALGNLSALIELSLHNNQLSGTIPAELGTLTNLTTLALANNQLSGCIPDELQAVSSNDFAQLGLSFCGAAVSASPDSLALVALYNATDGAKWINDTNWLSDKPIGQWYGVSTNDEGRATKLSLGFNELSGAIPAELGDLSDLIELSLHNNQLSGAIPAELGTLTNLTTLALANNQLSGCIPDELQAVSNNDFAQLGLSFCGAAVSASLDSLALVALYQATNGAKWTDNTNWLSDKPIGQWYGVSTNDEGRVTKLSLGFNELSGAIPSALGNLSALIELSLHNNQLSGAIPAELGTLTNLTTLALANNQLSGCIPDELQAVSNNDFSQLDLPFCGAVVSVSPDSLALVALYNATDGDNWTNNENWLSGKPIGDWDRVITDGNGRVTTLALISNQLSGSIPAELGNLSNLTTLRLSQNQLSGAIPAELGNLANLEVLWLHSNQLSGMIPSALGNLSNLTTLVLRGNQLSGSIPAELGNLSNLKTLFLSGNQLSGCVPDGLQGVLRDFAQLDLLFCGAAVSASPDSLALVALYNATDGSKWTDNTNWLSDKPIGQWYGVSTNDEGRATKLSLGFNELSGAMPSALGDLSDLIELSLHNNQLSGSIPAELGTLTNLTTLALANNQLSGCIPDGLQAVSNNDLSQLDLSFCGAAVSPPTVEIAGLVSTPASLREDAGATTITLTATLAAASATADTIRFALVAPTTGPEAIRDTDYAAATLGATVPLAAGATEATTTLTLTPIDNNAEDGDRFLGVEASIAASSAQTDIKISDDEGPSTQITLATNPTEIREDAGATEVRVTATLDGNVLAEDVTLQLVLASNATATRDLDYTAILGRLAIPAGKEQGMTTISITPTDDGVADGAEQIILTSETALTNEEGDPIAIEAATITLKDTGEHVEPPPPSDTTPTFAGTVADLSATVGAPIALIALPAATGNDPMTYAVSTLPAGLSFDPATRTLSGTPTAAGTTTVTYTVIDGDAESPESAAQTFTIVVTEAPASTVEIAGLVATLASLREDAGATTITLTATLTAASAADATIRFALVAPTTGPAAIRDTDYAAILVAAVPLAAGATEATTTLRLAPIDNNEADGDRSLGVEASIAGSSAQTDIKISDDEGPSTSIALSVNPAEISEQDGRVNVEVTATLDGAPLSENAIVTLSIDPASTASRDIDYSMVFAPQIQIPSGSTMGSTQLVIQPAADGEAEGDETIKLIGAINGLMGDEAEITLSEQAVPPEEETDDSALAFADDTAIADQEYTAGTPIDPLVLPEASGGEGELTYSVSTLPAGLVFDPATRTISGTPTAATDGAVTVTYTATDELGATLAVTFSITVNAGLSFGDLFDSFGAGKIVPTDSHDLAEIGTFVVGQSVEGLTLSAASGGTAPLTYSLSPALPAGLTFDSATRTIVGTPTAADETAYTYTVTDANGASASRSLQMRPAAFALANNFPNPFNPATAIQYALPQATDVELTVYNVVGQRVRTLVAEHQSAGRYVVEWDATDDSGHRLSSGIYFYRLQAGGQFRQIKKMLLLK